MSHWIRRLYNRLDRALDRRALRQTLVHEDALDDPRPRSARQAFEPIARWAEALDARVRFHSVSASHEDLWPDGTARSWLFRFDLPQIRATGVAEYRLVWDESADRWCGARLEAMANPALPPGSAMLKLVQDGKLLYAAACAGWQREIESRPMLPNDFRDSPEVCAELAKQGLDLSQTEASLSTGWKAETPVWVACDRTGKEWLVPFRSCQEGRRSAEALQPSSD